MRKLIPAIAIAGLGIVSLAASPARADEHGHRGEDRNRAPYSQRVRAMPAPHAAPVRYYRQDRWEAERARERQALEDRRAEFYSYRHNRRDSARFDAWYADRCHDLDAWYADRCHDLDRGLRINIGFGF